MKKARKELGLNQEQLAEHSGLSLGMIKNIERGAKWPSAASLEAISKALKVTPGTLFKDENEVANINDVMNLLAKTFHYSIKKKP